MFGYQLKPRHASNAAPLDAGDSWAQAQNYGGKSGFRVVTNSESDSEFSYPTTGEFEDWLADREGIAAILVELSSRSSNQFNTYRNAMWNLAQLP